MNKSLFLFFIFFLSINISNQKDNLEYSFEFSFRLEKNEQYLEWNKRGDVIFKEKDNEKMSIKVVSSPITTALKLAIKKECDENGTYFVKFKGNKNTYFSSANPVRNFFINLYPTKIFFMYYLKKIFKYEKS